MEIERDYALRGWWLSYDKEDEREKNIIQWRKEYVKPESEFIDDATLRKLYPIVKQFGIPKLEV